MVLVTSSTISTILSSSVIGLFTFLLFLSGYVLQQQSVRSIQAVIQQSPSTIRYKAALSLSQLTVLEESIHVWNQNENDRTQKTEEYPTHPESPFGRPTRDHPEQEPLPKRIQHAYLQILSNPNASDICSSILFFDTLSSSSIIPSDRIILYPQSWDTQSPTKSVSSALRILKQSSDKFNVFLHAIDTSDIQGRAASESQLLKRASPILAGYERILFLRSPGYLVDITNLEHLFTADIMSGNDLQNTPGGEGKDTPIWVPFSTRLFALYRPLPPAFLISTTSSIGRGSARQPDTRNEISLNPHILNPIAMQQRNAIMESSESLGRFPSPTYVYFERDMVGRRRKDQHYTQWKKKVQSVCHGVNLGF